MIGPAYRSRAAQAVLGPSRSELIPAVLWTGWLNAAGDVVAMTGMSLTHAVFGPAGDGVANIVPLDCGVAATGWEIAAIGLFDAAADGTLIASATLTDPVIPDEGDPLVFDVGALTFTVS